MSLIKITHVELTASAAAPSQFPAENLPEIALVGRSNVGKSSLINALLKRKNLARTSSTPGRTRLIFFYKVNQLFYLVDLPGYGYAQAGKAQWEEVRARADGYFRQRGEKIKGVLVVVDAKVGLSPLDREMVDYLRANNIAFDLILNKADKVNQGELHRTKNEIRAWVEKNFIAEPLLFSARTGRGREDLWKRLSDLLSDKQPVCERNQS